MEDIGFLNANADFETKISRDVYWVPVNRLGKSRYTNAEIKNISELYKPIEKKKKLNNLYEVIQLFFCEKFTYSMDTEYIVKNHIIWETHRESEKVVEDNTGCCSSVASWLRYYLEGIYEECGYFSFIRPNGTGHVFNYIKKEGWYYLIDLTPYVIDKKQDDYFESGMRIDFIKSGNVTGCLMKCKRLESYASFYNKLQNVGGYNFIYIKIKNKNIVPIATLQKNTKLNIFYPDYAQIECIYNGNKQKYSIIMSKYS